MKRYPAYKDSGIEWLGEVPEGWEVKRLKYVCNEYAEYGLNIEAENYQLEGVRFIRTTDIDDYGNLKSNGVYINPALAKDYILKDGDLLISRSGTIGRSFLYESSRNEEATYAGYLVRYSLDLKKAYPKYLFYFTLSYSFYEWLKTQLIETTISNVNGQKYANMFLPLPPKDEQIRLSTFLDNQTAKIDELIKKNETLVELLKEKRQAIISQAVTKGLDPNAKMHVPVTEQGKDSEIEWRGEVPVGWEVKRLKYVANVNPEALTENINTAYELKYVDISNVGEEGLINKPEIMLFEDAPSRARRIIRQNDVIVSTVRTYLKAIAYFPNPDSNLIASTGFAVLRASDAVLPKLLYYFVRSDFFVESIMANSVGVSYPAINSSVVAGLPILVPPKNQQSEIIKFLDKETKKYNDLMKKILSQTAILKEYRQALISNVVTGKVKVDEYAKI